jgi:hypothetical protein
MGLLDRAPVGARGRAREESPAMAQRSRSLYSTSALRVAQRVFTLSVAEPTNLFLHGEDFPLCQDLVRQDPD